MYLSQYRYLYLCYYSLLVTIYSLKRFLKKPLDEIISQIIDLAQGDTSDVKIINLPGELMPISDALIKAKSDLSKAKKKLVNQTEKETRRQINRVVAHDIIQPLETLDILVRKKISSEDGIKNQISQTLDRIKDIAERIVLSSDDINKNSKTNDIKKHHLISLIEPIITEFRVKLSYEGNQNIKFNYSEEAYNLFAKVNQVSFKRVVSNMINNSVKAIAQNGNITLEISKDISGKNAYLSIIDDGVGIPQKNLQEIFRPDFSFWHLQNENQKGTGLGLSKVEELIKSWEGSINVESRPGNTKFKITLPLTPSYNWFEDEIYIFNNTQVVIVDDDRNIHNVWKERLTNHSKDQINYFTSPNTFSDWYKNQDKSQDYIFLIDYEFSNFNLNGVDLIKKEKIENKSVLVTSHHKEEAIQKQCDGHKISMIPKGLMNLVPIIKCDNPQIILVDDDDLVQDDWQLEAEKKKYLGHDFINS